MSQHASDNDAKTDAPEIVKATKIVDVAESQIRSL